MQTLTILTAPPIGLRHILRHPFRSFLERKAIGGHYAVTSQTISGLRKLNTVKYRLDPRFLISRSVLVLSGVEATEWAVCAKTRGKIDMLAVGPNVVVRADENNSLIADQQIDKIIVPSTWVAGSYVQQVSTVKSRIVVWPVGINLDDWPVGKSKDSRERKILVYQKNADKDFFSDVKSLVAKYATVVTIEYGCHSQNEYRKVLAEVDAAVFLSKSESQGIALLECWAMDVPTLVWQPNSLEINGWRFGSFSSAPYLSMETGVRWHNLSQLTQEIKRLSSRRVNFSPREWVEKNMTDTIQAEKLVNILYDNRI